MKIATKRLLETHLQARSGTNSNELNGDIQELYEGLNELMELANQLNELAKVLKPLKSATEA